jgi:hypothetical protein
MGFNSRPGDACDRATLLGHVDAYLDALVARDPSRLPWADEVVFTEQNVQLAVGDGLWGTISGRRDYNLTFADPKSGQAGWIGLVEEHGVPGIMALRLRIEKGAISEVETVLSRRDDPGPFPVIGEVNTPHPIFFEDVPPAQRRPRARMIAIADGYFDTLQLNDGTLFTEFTDDCDRVENGMQTTNNPGVIMSYDITRFGCAEQFRKGQFVYDDRLRDRRFPLVDEEKGLVLAAGFIDHSGRVLDFHWTDGTPSKSVFFYPHSFVLLELFKIVDGKIARIEAVFTTVPYNMPSPWPPERR